MNEIIKNICVKYLMYEANLEELETLDNWVQKPKNKQLFAIYIKVNYAMDMYMNPFDTETAKKEYLERIRKDKRIQKKRKLLKTVRYAAAAILIIALASTYFLNDTIFNNKIENTFNNKNENTTPTIVNNQIEPGIDKATLTLENGEQITLEKGTQFQTQNATSNGEEIVYASKPTTNNQQPTTNILTIPRGGQFQMTLSDGTKVWLNSETQLKYPVSFTDGESRQVELVYGEAYFDVSPSTAHKAATFKVLHPLQEVEVLGTEFNIKAYKDETNIYTTLVEGKVAVTPIVMSSRAQSRDLTPTQQSNLNIKNGSMTTATVDVHVATSWKDGLFDFEKMPLKEIMKTLSRWYDMEVDFKKEALKSIILTGVFKKSQSIEEIMMAIQNTNDINSYEIHNKTITIK